MIRLIGAFALLAIMGYGSYETSKKEKKKLAVLEAWIALLYYVRSQIDCFSLPFPIILKNADQSLKSTLGMSEEPATAEQLIDKSAPFLSGESHALLCSFSKEIGTTYKEEQLKRCDYYLKALEAQRDQMKQTLPMRIKMLMTLHLCAGLGAVILLW